MLKLNGELDASQGTAAQLKQDLQVAKNRIDLEAEKLRQVQQELKQAEAQLKNSTKELGSTKGQTSILKLPTEFKP